MLIKLSMERSISFIDARAKLGKVEALHEKLIMEKAKVESRFPFIKDATLAAQFVELVGEGLQQSMKAGLSDVNLINNFAETLHHPAVYLTIFSR